MITVGAVDLEGSINVRSHDVPNWSAYGYTKDGFRKPELAAAGRYMVGPGPDGGDTARGEAGERRRTPATCACPEPRSAAPVVAGAAAQLLIEHPTWTPDQIKGALMQRARYIPEAPAGSAGVGEINAARSSLLTRPPNPNAALNKFRQAGRTAGDDGVRRQGLVRGGEVERLLGFRRPGAMPPGATSPGRDVSWSDVSWSDASWSDVSWSDVLAAADVSWEDNAEGEVANPAGDYLMTPEEEAAALADPELNPDAPAAVDPAPRRRASAGTGGTTP